MIRLKRRRRIAGGISLAHPAGRGRSVSPDPVRLSFVPGDGPTRCCPCCLAWLPAECPDLGQHREECTIVEHRPQPADVPS